MSVEFCPNCDSLLRKKRWDDGKVYWTCDCGFKKIASQNRKSREVHSYEKKNLISKTLVLENTNQIENPTTDVICPKCSNTKAEYFQYQTRSADEPATTFYRCTKCGHKWREY